MKVKMVAESLNESVYAKLNEEMKINAAKKYCKENKIKYVYLKKVLTNINEIIN
jgi:hypothetical protein